MLPFNLQPIFPANEKFDLYGPLWVLITLIISIAIFGNITQYVDSFYSEKKEFLTSVTTITSCATLLISYFIFVPLGLYILFQCNGADQVNYF